MQRPNFGRRSSGQGRGTPPEQKLLDFPPLPEWATLLARIGAGVLLGLFLVTASKYLMIYAGRSVEARLESKFNNPDFGKIRVPPEVDYTVALAYWQNASMSFPACVVARRISARMNEASTPSEDIQLITGCLLNENRKLLCMEPYRRAVARIIIELLESDGPGFAILSLYKVLHRDLLEVGHYGLLSVSDFQFPDKPPRALTAILPQIFNPGKLCYEHQ